MRKAHGRVLLVLISLLILISTVNGEMSNNTSSIYNDNDTRNINNSSSSYNRTPDDYKVDESSKDSSTNKTIINKSKVDIKIFRRPKETSGFEVMLTILMMTIIYILKTKKMTKGEHEMNIL